MLALLFFLGELFVFKTLGWRTAMQPLIIACERLFTALPSVGIHGGFSWMISALLNISVAAAAVISAVWMSLGWNYYTTMATECAISTVHKMTSQSCCSQTTCRVPNDMCRMSEEIDSKER